MIGLDRERARSSSRRTSTTRATRRSRPTRAFRLRHAGHRGRQPDATTSARPACASTRSRSRRRREAQRFHRRLVNACIRAHAQTEPLRPGAAPRRHHRRRRHRRRARRRAAPHRRASSSPTASTASIPRRTCRSSSSRRPTASCRPCRSACRTRRWSCWASSASSVRTSARRSPRCSPTACGWPTAAMIPAELVVWAAGVKAPDLLQDLDGLETNRINQLVVLPTLQTTRDDDIFAIGDCAACAWPEPTRQGGLVPPRAQAAHQQASHMVKQIRRRLAGRRSSPSLPRLRLAGLARRVLHRRQPDGRADRRQPVDRGRCSRA